MSYAGLLTQTATRRRFVAGAKDAIGTRDHSTVATATVACRIDNRGVTSTPEGPVGADIGRWLAFLPPDADVTADDELVVAGQTYRVVGDPWPVQGRSGTHHLEATLTKD